MKVKRSAPVPGADERRHGNRKSAQMSARRQVDAPARRRRTAPEQRPQRPARSGPQTSPVLRPTDGAARPKSTSQAKARAKARKAKAPKVVRPPLRERLITRLAAIELNPRTLMARVPFVVLVIGALGLGLGVTLWLSTDAAERSYQLGHARQLNQALLQQKEALERDVLEAQAAPALAEAARNLGMIPSRDTAHLVQDPAGNWMVVGTPKPAQGVPPPPLNTPLPDETPVAAGQSRLAVAAPPAPRVVDPREVTVRLPAPLADPAAAAPPAPAVAPDVAVPPAAAPLPLAPLLADAGQPHLASPQLPAQPGPVGGAEQFSVPAVAAPAPVPGAPA